MDTNKNTHTPRDDKSLGTLFFDLTQEVTTLFRQEIGLVKTEMSEKVSQAQSGVISLFVGGAVAYAGFLFLLGAAVFGLALVMDAWLATLIVAVIVLVIGISMIAKAKSNLKGHNLKPKRTIDQFKRNKTFAEQHLHGNKAAGHHTA